MRAKRVLRCAQAVGCILAPALAILGSPAARADVLLLNGPPNVIMTLDPNGTTTPISDPLIPGASGTSTAKTF